MAHSTMNGHATSSKRVYKVVLTGGPCGGKTTGQSRLCTFFENMGWKVYRVPETAYLFLSGGIKFGDLSENEAVRFQENLLKNMIQIENTFLDLAETCPKNCLVICDRGTMDAAAFISEENWEAIMRRNGWNPVDLRDTRYNQIIHMVSAAHGAEAFYTTEDHATRSENITQARHLDDRAAQAWVGHPYFDVIDNSTEFDSKMRRMISAVCQKLGIDTGDRLSSNARKVKFLVKGPLPDDTVFPNFQDFNVEHIYLRTNSRKMQARLRKRGKNGHHSYTHTIRKPEQLGQIVEVKTPISHRDWINMSAQMDEHHLKIYKKRRCFLHNNQYFQLDIYQQPCHKRCEGLILLETYTTLASEELQRRLPSFLRIESDVTGRPDYSMFNLSLRDEWATTNEFCVNIAVAADKHEPACGSCPSSNLDLQRRQQRPDLSPNSKLASIAPYNPILPCDVEMRSIEGGGDGLAVINGVGVVGVGDLVVGSAPVKFSNPVCVSTPPVRITNGFNAPEH